MVVTGLIHDGDDGLEMFHYREGVVEVMQGGTPLLIRRGAPKTLRVILQALPFRQEQEAAGSLDAAFDSQRRETRTAGDVDLCFLHRLEKGVFLPGNDLEQGVLGDHALSNRARNAGSVAASIAVQASAIAPSRTAASAEGVTQAAANSR